ncbi:hypothetical protein ACQ4PT_026627 [Festuca glaucescens]
MAPHYILLGILLLHTSPCSSFAAANGDTLTAGQALRVGEKLVSRNGKFALGFFQFQPASTISKSSHNVTSPSPSLWYLGIWFHKIPVFTVVWVANRDEPITHPNLNLSQLKISSDGNLVIVVNHSSYTQSVVWSTHIVENRTQTSSINTTISDAILLNTGNLAITSKQKMLWQSFDYPTDVGLPSAKFGRNKVTGLNRQGISRKSLIDPGIASYSLELVDISGIILKRRNNPLVVYWRYASSRASALNLLPILKSLFDLDPRTKDLFSKITYVNNNQEEYYMYTLQDETSSSVFVSLDISGQIKLNVWSQANQSWQIIFSQPDDPCDPPASCGPFTVCSGKPHPSCDFRVNAKKLVSVPAHVLLIHMAVEYALYGVGNCLV